VVPRASAAAGGGVAGVEVIDESNNAAANEGKFGEQ
jgi:hypothetical protein